MLNTAIAQANTKNLTVGQTVTAHTGSTKNGTYKLVTGTLVALQVRSLTSGHGTAEGVVEADGVTYTTGLARISPAPQAEAAPVAVSAENDRFPAWFNALIAQNLPLAAADVEAFERAAYGGHISYDLSMTDGYYAPQDFETWVYFFRKNPISIYSGNDARYKLTPQINAYIALQAA